MTVTGLDDQTVNGDITYQIQGIASSTDDNFNGITTAPVTVVNKEADAAGIVLGARVPIILTSRADSLLTRLASCAVALLLVAAKRGAAAIQ